MKDSGIAKALHPCMHPSILPSVLPSIQTAYLVQSGGEPVAQEREHDGQDVNHDIP